MKFVIERDTLFPVLKHLQSVVEKRNTIPILGNIKVTAETPGTVTLTSSNMDIWLTETVPAHVTKSGQTTVSAQKLVDTVGGFDKNLNVEVSVDNDVMLVKSGRRRFKLGCLDVQDFPPAPVIESAQPFAISAENFGHLVGTPLPFVSDEATRYYLTGVHLHTEDDGAPRLCAVATNGHSLARVTGDIPTGAESMPPIIIPQKTCNVALKLFTDGDISVTVSQTIMSLSNESVSLVSKLIDGTFPEYKRVIPTENPNRLSIDRLALQNSINAVSCIQEDKTRSVILSIGQDAVEIEARESDDSGSDVIDAEYSGDDLRLGFNSRLALSILASISAETVTMQLAGAQDPIVFQGTNDASSTFVLMPMRV